MAGRESRAKPEDAVVPKQVRLRFDLQSYTSLIAVDNALVLYHHSSSSETSSLTFGLSASASPPLSSMASRTWDNHLAHHGGEYRLLSTDMTWWLWW